jgi:hypothetical protein
MIFFIHIFSFCLLFQVHGMLYDGTHNHEHYENLANSDEAFKASCCVFDQKNGIQQSGVLIKPDIVATSAHGVVETLKRNITLLLNEKKYKIFSVNDVKVIFDIDGCKYDAEVDKVIIDNRYLVDDLGEEAKFDMAFLKLKKSIPEKDIKPAQLMPDGFLENDHPMVVVSYGNVDYKKKHSCKRAFYLLETHPYHHGLSEFDFMKSSRSVNLSSIFFKAEDFLKKPNELYDDEATIRSYYANQSWKKAGKPPYAMGLPGTSGSPIFITAEDEYCQKKTYLIGIVTSFANLSGEFLTYKGKKEVEYLLKKPEDAYNKYITILALFYKQSNDPRKIFSNKRYYNIDQDLIKAIETLENN